MKERVLRLVAFGFLLMATQIAIFGQTTGSISGTVIDSNGQAVPNATVVVSGEAGQEYTVVTTEDGIYRVPAVASGLYTVVITAPSFKRSVIEGVKVDTGVPATVNTALQAGDISETVTVTGGGEVLQTQTATVGTTIQGRQITETPIASRDALDLVALLPGTATVGRPRAASINGLPKGALSITIDGVDVQDNSLRSSDGFFTYVRPRIDAIEEVTVSTANPGSESSGDGAVQIKFITRRGTNDYRGGLFWQHRDESLNSNYWYQNRDAARDSNGRAFRQKIRLNQYGGNFGGPIPFLRFGDGGGSLFESGKDKRFFFVNYEEFRIPQSVARTRTVLTPAAQLGDFSYLVGGVPQVRNLFTVASANGQLSTIDPTIAAVLARIQSGVASEGTITPISSNPNRSFYNFTNSGNDVRKFLAARVDFNLTKNNSFEFVMNRQEFVPSADFLNARDPIFPGFPFYGQGGVRKSYTGALRSNFGSNIVNEARYATSGGATDFFGSITPGDFAFSQGFFLDIGTPGGVTNPYNNNFSQVRATPTYDLTDAVTWINGNHTINLGGQFKIVRTEQTNSNRIVPTISFGLSSTEAAFSIFNTTSLPGATPAQLTEARNLYATLVGRVSGFASNAYLGSDGQYVENGPQTQIFDQRTYGLFAQDTWRIRPGLTLNFGLRWQPTRAFTIKTANVGKLEDPDQIFGVSGPGNIFKPGVFEGEAPRVVLYEVGEKAHKDDLNNFAPSVGVVWSPDFKDGILGTMFGEAGRSVFRGGYSRAFIREGSALQTTITGNTPGGLLALTRSTAVAGSLILGTNLRDPNNPNLISPGFSSTPSFPLSLTTANQALIVDPDIETGYVDSFSFGYQREIDRNTVFEVRYVGNRGQGVDRLNFVNEVNTIENGFAAEFSLAQRNLYANEAAFAAGQTNRRLCPGFTNGMGNCVVSSTNSTPVNRVATFAFFGAGSGTTPLPIILAYFNNYGNPAAYQAAINSTAQYLSAANFGNSTLISLLSVNNPQVQGFVGNASFENNAVRRANAITNGLPSNFFRVNPSVPAGAFILSDTAKTWYDSAVFEVRRRLSDGLRVQASYVFAKAQSDSFASSGTQQSNYTLREGGLELAKNVQVFDIRHNFKADITYDLPIGRGRALFGNSNRLVNALIGGFTILPTVRWQSGSPFSLGNVTLVGMTVKDLQKEIGVRKGPNVVTYLPDDIILNSQRAFDININNSTGYGSTFEPAPVVGGVAPTGRFIAPAGFGNCQSRFAGDCGFNNLILYGPSFFQFDAAVAKKFIIDEKRNVEIRATFLDVLNQPSFRVGGFGADVVNLGVGGSTFGQLPNGSAYQDLSTTNNPGGRMIDLMIRFNF